MSKSILLIEDEEDLRELISLGLRDAGIQESIYESFGPMEGLDIFNKHKHDLGLVICDQYMPYANGTEICEIIKRDRPDVEIIIFTGDKGFVLGNHENTYVNAVFYKPEGLKDLCEYVKSHNISTVNEHLPLIDPLEIKNKFITVKNSYPGLIIKQTQEELHAILPKRVNCLTDELIGFKLESTQNLQMSGKIQSIQDIDSDCIKLIILLNGSP